MMFLMIALTTPTARAGDIEDQTFADRPISLVTIKGLSRISEQEVKNNLRIGAGEPYESLAVRADVASLYRLGHFETVTAEASLQPDGTAREIAGDIFGTFEVLAKTVQPHKLLAPIAPTNLMCIGLNYRKHAAEGNVPVPERPVLFMKATTAVQNPGDPIVLPRHMRSDEVDYECELAVVIGKRCKNVRREQALDYVLGYTCANDVSARDWQIKWGGSQW
ncbi:MAG: fumarylacetoacetate hydrolase family protein, partial [Phycisphaerae bacterium]